MWMDHIYVYIMLFGTNIYFTFYHIHIRYRNPMWMMDYVPLIEQNIRNSSSSALIIIHWCCFPDTGSHHMKYYIHRRRYVDAVKRGMSRWFIEIYGGLEPFCRILKRLMYVNCGRIRIYHDETKVVHLGNKCKKKHYREQAIFQRMFSVQSTVWYSSE